MTGGAKDSVEVMQFMALFARLKLVSDDAPEHLEELAASDPAVRKLCDDLCILSLVFTSNERRRRKLFAAPVDPSFIVAWRDYEHRFEPTVSNIWLSELLTTIGGPGQSHAAAGDRQWNSLDEEAKDHAVGIENAIAFAQSNANQDWRWDESQEKFIEGIHEGVAAWERIKDEVGFDLRGVFRRRSLVPFVLIPRQVAARHGDTERLSMLKNLQHAHEAFIYGATYGALAVMRSVMEAVLRDHYRADGRDLSERIRNARGRLPPGASEAVLHRLRRLANSVLHLERPDGDGLPKMDDIRLEREVVSLLYARRALLAGAR